MVFVDAQRYLKVQDQDLDDAFDDGNRHSRESREDKYSKASFEEFQLDPTLSPKDTPAWKKYMIPIIIYTFIAVIVTVGLILLIIFGMQGDEGNEYFGDESEIGEEEDVVEKVVAIGSPFVGDAIEKVKRAVIAIRR